MVPKKNMILIHIQTGVEDLELGPVRSYHGSNIQGGAPCLVVHDAAVGVQGEGDTAAKCVHGLGQGEQKNGHSSDSTH